MIWRALALFPSLMITPALAHAHALEPGYLQFSKLSEDTYRVFFRIPDVQGASMDISALLPETCETPQARALKSDGRAWVSAWVTTCPDGLTGKRVEISGLERQNTDVLMRYPDAGGEMRAHRFTPTQTGFVIPERPSALDIFTSYLPLGFDHILEGIDHLLFVFALMLLIPNLSHLIGAITAFTIAHSITLAGVTLGWFSLPGPPVEAVIALSIMFVAAELLRKDTVSRSLGQRYPWVISFSFGLLHGFGFAGALQDIGLPQNDIPLALLAFNLGVELGQLLFVFVLLIAAGLLRYALGQTFRVQKAPALKVAAYGIGIVSAYWFIERLVGFLSYA